MGTTQVKGTVSKQVFDTGNWLIANKVFKDWPDILSTMLRDEMDNKGWVGKYEAWKVSERESKEMERLKKETKKGKRRGK